MKKNVVLTSLLFMVLLFFAVSCGDDTADAGDTADTGNTADTGDTADTGNSADTGNTVDTGNTADTSDSADTGNTAGGSWGDFSFDQTGLVIDYTGTDKSNNYECNHFNDGYEASFVESMANMAGGIFTELGSCPLNDKLAGACIKRKEDGGTSDESKLTTTYFYDTDERTMDIETQKALCEAGPDYMQGVWKTYEK